VLRPLRDTFLAGRRFLPGVAKLSGMNRNPDNEPHFLPKLLLALGINAVVALIAYYAYVSGLFSH
jgi:hypothetical protein